MIGRLQRNRSLFFAAFDREAALIKDPHLEAIDAVLDDEQLIEIVRGALARRRPRSRTRGREGIAPDRVLRSCVLKHIKGWSFRDLERELRGSLVYRRFTRFDSDPIPDFSNFSRAFAALGDDLTRQIHARIVVHAIHDGIAPGRKLRTDTTVTESNIHYPTDSNLLADGIRVLTRAAKRISQECAKNAVNVVDHTRAAKHRVLEIVQAAKSFTDAAREQVKSSYSKLLGLVRSVVHKAEEVTSSLKDGTLPVVGKATRVVVERAKLEHFLPLVKTVIEQTKARVFEGNTHFKGKLVSIFEEHTQVLCKGKAHKPTEFGRLVRVDEVENGIVSNYEIVTGNPSDQEQWTPAVSDHKKIFGHAPNIATADRGFSSATNERAAEDLGVKKVVLPRKGRLSEARKKIQGQRWFKRAMKWRGGIEARIATLKHRFDMGRAHYKGDIGFKRYVGWSVISNNLTRIARLRSQRRAQTHSHEANRAA